MVKILVIPTLGSRCDGKTATQNRPKEKMLEIGVLGRTSICVVAYFT